MGVLHAEAVGPYQAQAADPGRSHRVGLQPRALRAGLRESCAEHDHGPDALGRRGSDNAGDGGSRGNHDGEIDLAGDASQIGVGWLAADRRRWGDRDHLARETSQVLP